MKIVIIGNGPAAVAAAETVRELDRHCPLTMISLEAMPFYSPCPLAEYVEDSVPRAHLFLRDEQFYRARSIETLFGRPATAIDTAARRVKVGDGEAAAWVDYDRLLIAAGARAVMPPIPGLAGTPGVFALKNIADADAILARLPSTRRAVVIGSGFIGLEAAQALVRRRVAVTVVEAQDRVLPLMLDHEMAAQVEARLREHGIDVRLNSRAEAVLGGERGVVAVRAGGVDLPCDLVVCAAGVRPDLALVAGSGIDTAIGVLVDEEMETNVPGVFAAGDIVEALDHQGRRRVLPIWPNAVDGGKVAGANMVKAGSRRFRGLVNINVVRIFDLPVASFGAQSGERNLRHEADGALRKLAIAGGKLIGGQFYGDVNGVGMYHEMMNKGAAVGERDDLLSPHFGYGSLTPRPAAARRVA